MGDRHAKRCIDFDQRNFPSENHGVKERYCALSTGLFTGIVSNRLCSPDKAMAMPGGCHALPSSEPGPACQNYHSDFASHGHGEIESI
jgi:hypothetical protein